MASARESACCRKVRRRFHTCKHNLKHDPNHNPMIKTLNAMRYITPLREGGSMPAVVEADDGQLYVMKFVGAGQGRKALIADLVAGEIGRTLGLLVPEMAFINLDAALVPSEPDP